MFQITSNTRRKRSNAIHEVKNAWKNNKEIFRLKFSLVKLLYFECFRSLQTHAIRDRMQSMKARKNNKGIILFQRRVFVKFPDKNSHKRHLLNKVHERL